MSDKDKKESRYATHARREMDLCGYLNDAYGRKMFEHIMKLLDVFAAEGHSGFSAATARQLFAKLADFKPLSPLTNDPEEWIDVGPHENDEPSTWQNVRNSEAFSRDGGVTYFLLSETQAIVRCDKCGSGYSGSPRKRLRDDEKSCSNQCGGKMVITQEGLERDDPKAQHTSLVRKTVNA